MPWLYEWMNVYMYAYVTVAAGWCWWCWRLGGSSWFVGLPRVRSQFGHEVADCGCYFHNHLQSHNFLCLFCRFIGLCKNNKPLSCPCFYECNLHSKPYSENDEGQVLNNEHTGWMQLEGCVLRNIMSYNIYINEGDKYTWLRFVKLINSVEPRTIK